MPALMKTSLTTIEERTRDQAHEDEDVTDTVNSTAIV